mmetsp:Transcript_9999/g.30690  ORF Transcript_9999/g.30690 Transcript_9999/m.30690 type:complete len:344 (-) Transcript_9999:7-1038(-)
MPERGYSAWREPRLPCAVRSLGLLGGALIVGGRAALASSKADGDVLAVETNHRWAEVLGDPCKHLRIIVVGDGLDDGPRPLLGVGRLEDAGANEDAIHAKLHEQGGISGGGNTAGGKVDNGESSNLGCLLEQMERSLNLLGVGVELVLVHRLDELYLAHESARVANGLDDVAGTGLSLGADHCRAFGDAAQSLTQIAAATDKRDGEVVLVGVVVLVGHCQHLRLVNVVSANLLKDLALDEVANTRLGHYGDGDGRFDFFDHLGVRHAGDTAILTNICRHALQRHHRTGTGLFCNPRLLRVDHVHDDSAFKHLCHASLDCEGALVGRHGGLSLASRGGGLGTDA